MNKYYPIFFCLLIASCTSQKGSHTKTQMQETYIYVFKMHYFKRLLVEGFNKSDEIKKIVAKDASGRYGEPILSIEDLNLMDSLVRIDNRTMVADSINRIGKVSEGVQGKHVFTYALGKFESKWLDSLAKVRYKIFRRKESQQPN